MKARQFKDAVFEQFARIAAAFASPKRIEILDVLAQGERRVDILAGATQLTIANASRHLQVLKNARLVEARRDGLQVFYRLADPMVLQGYRTLQALARNRLAEIDRLVRDYFEDRDGLEPLSRDDLVRRARKKEVVLLDVRPREEFEAGHIAGAVSVPLAELMKRLADIPSGKTVVAYCRGPYCVLAAEAVHALRERGIKTFRFAEGYPEWRDAGLPVETQSGKTD